MNVNHKVLDFAMVRFEAEAKAARDDAGYGGRMDDGGYRRMIGQLEAYAAGIRGEIPDFLQKHYDAIMRENDPEYARYLELKTKFGDE